MTINEPVGNLWLALTYVMLCNQPNTCKFMVQGFILFLVFLIKLTLIQIYRERIYSKKDFFLGFQYVTLTMTFYVLYLHLKKSH